MVFSTGTHSGKKHPYFKYWDQYQNLNVFRVEDVLDPSASISLEWFLFFFSFVAFKPPERVDFVIKIRRGLEPGTFGSFNLSVGQQERNFRLFASACNNLNSMVFFLFVLVHLVTGALSPRVFWKQRNKTFIEFVTCNDSDVLRTFKFLYKSET